MTTKRYVYLVGDYGEYGTGNMVATADRPRVLDLIDLKKQRYPRTV
jgi:hypothetical protein